MTTLLAAAAMATIVIEPENLLRMTISLGLQCVSGIPLNRAWKAAFLRIGLGPGCKVGAKDGGAVGRKCGKPDATGRSAEFRGLCGVALQRGET